MTRPEQLLATLPQVARVLTDPADAGPVVLALPQDVQVEEWDFPVALFSTRLHRVPRPRPDVQALAEAVALLRAAQRPLLVAGGGGGLNRAVTVEAGDLSADGVSATAGRPRVGRTRPNSADGPQANRSTPPHNLSVIMHKWGSCSGPMIPICA